MLNFLRQMSTIHCIPSTLPTLHVLLSQLPNQSTALRSLKSLSVYRNTREEYKTKDWSKEPVSKFRLRGRVREAKRQVQSSVSQERTHVDVRFDGPFPLIYMNLYFQELETYSRAVSSRSGSVVSFASNASISSGLDLGRSRPYRTDSVSIRAVSHSPPSASLEDISNDEARDVVRDHVSDWLSKFSLATTPQEDLDTIFVPAASFPPLPPPLSLPSLHVQDARPIPPLPSLHVQDPPARSRSRSKRKEVLPDPITSSHANTQRVRFRLTHGQNNHAGSPLGTEVSSCEVGSTTLILHLTGTVIYNDAGQRLSFVFSRLMHCFLVWMNFFHIPSNLVSFLIILASANRPFFPLHSVTIRGLHLHS